MLGNDNEGNQSGKEFVDDKDGETFKFRKCTNCNRPTKEYPGNSGRHCENEPIEGNQLKACIL